MSFLRNVVFGAAFAMTAPSAYAATVTFTDRVAFEAAAGGVQTEDFSSQTVGLLAENTANGGFNGFTVTWSDVSGSNMGVGIDDPGFDNRLAWGEDLFFNGSGQVGPTITLEFDAPILAIGFDWFDDDTTDVYSLTVGGETFVNGPFDSNGSGDGFFGLVSDVGFSTLVFTSTAQGGFVRPFGVDNIAYALEPNVVPLPAGLPLLLTGLAGLSFAGRRKSADAL
ncbi:MAG: VPLPA-CTERM sorting domain-containing protein [Pseudomonadota bacterium]